MRNKIINLREITVNYIGYLTAPTGLGTGARTYISALLNQQFKNINCIDITYTTPHTTDESLFKHKKSCMKFAEINIIHVNAPELPYVMKLLGKKFFEKSYNIGIWAWETPTLPKNWKDNLKYLNEVWALSHFTTKAINIVSTIPVITMPYASPIISAKKNIKIFGASDNEFIFLFNFDYLSMIERKNPQAIIEAFKLAFTKKDPVRLIIKTINGKSSILEEASKDIRITFINQTLNVSMHHQLLASCDCYISLHRAEGFGLGMAEAMSLGKPVIATGWSGNMDFMSVNNAFLVKYQLKKTEKDIPNYPADSLWAEPEICHAAHLMREVYSFKETRENVGKQAKHDIQNFFSIAVLERNLNERLATIANSAINQIYPNQAIKKLKPKVFSYKNMTYFMRLPIKLNLISPYFDNQWYVSQLKIPIKNKRLCMIHYLFWGWKKLLQPHPHFDTSWYLKKNLDLHLDNTEPLEHFILYGKKEGRSPHPSCVDKPCTHFDSASE